MTLPQTLYAPTRLTDARRLSVLLLAVLFFGAGCFWSGESRADWSLNLGYQNPANAQYGINFLYEGSNWGFEGGVGYIDINVEKEADDSTESKKNEADFRVGGEIDIRYFFRASLFVPTCSWALVLELPVVSMMMTKTTMGLVSVLGVLSWAWV